MLSWKTTTRSAPGVAVGRPSPQRTSPSSSITPELMSVNPATADSSVLLPQPDGPTTTCSSPGPISRLQPSTATTGAPEAAYTLPTSRRLSRPPVTTPSSASGSP